jgi:hypothetical protein
MACGARSTAATPAWSWRAAGRSPTCRSGISTSTRRAPPADTVRGPALNKVAILDVGTGIESTSSRIAQWFNSTIARQRPDSIGFRQVAVDGEDHHLTIQGCSIGIQIECRGTDCGSGSEWDLASITTDCVDAPCVAVRAFPRSGAPVDDYTADPACKSHWGKSTTIDGAPIRTFNTAC